MKNQETTMDQIQGNPDNDPKVNEGTNEVKEGLDTKAVKEESKGKSSFRKGTAAGLAAGMVLIVVLLSVMRSSGGNEMTELLEIKTKLPEIEMVYVAGGTFKMGATPEQFSDAFDNEFPVHEVKLSGYYIGKYEVTQALWESVMGENPCVLKGPNLPVDYVSWNDVQEFIRKLNAMTGKRYRLPTEAEWEYAARGGNKSRGYKYSGSNDVGTVAWYSGNSGGKTHPVGTKAANELGIHDMSGNVWEWCSDWYGAYSDDSQTNPRGPSSGSRRVLRGGSWFSDEVGYRVSDRSYDSPDFRDDYLGFRLAASSL